MEVTELFGNGTAEGTTGSITGRLQCPTKSYPLVIVKRFMRSAFRP